MCTFPLITTGNGDHLAPELATVDLCGISLSLLIVYSASPRVLMLKPMEKKKRIKSQSASLTLGGSLWPLMSPLLWFPLQNQESSEKLEEERQSMGLKLISHFLNRIYSCYERLLAVMIVNILESQSWPLQFEVLTVIISHLESFLGFAESQLQFSSVFPAISN